MPPKVIICDLCGGKFFRHSIEKHLKVCRERVGIQLHPCPYCGTGVPMLEMDAHVARCPEAKAAGAMPTGQSEALRRRLQKDKLRQENGLAPGEDDRALGGGNADIPPEFAEDEDVRVPCKICGRKFTFDRVAKHQAICQKVANTAPREVFRVTRTYNEGGSKGAVIGVSSTRSGKGRGKGMAVGLASKPNPKPMSSHWREESESFREGIKAAREHPLPSWGGNSDGSCMVTPTRPSGKPSRPSPRPSNGVRSITASGGGQEQFASPVKQRRGASTRREVTAENRARTESPVPLAGSSTRPSAGSGNVATADRAQQNSSKQRKAASLSPAPAGRDAQVREYGERQIRTPSPRPPGSSARPNVTRPLPKRTAGREASDVQTGRRVDSSPGLASRDANLTTASRCRSNSGPPADGRRPNSSPPAGSALAAIRQSHGTEGAR